MIGTRNISLMYFLNSLSLKKDLLYFDKFIVENENLEKSLIVGEILSKSLCDHTGDLFKKNVQEIEELEKHGLIEFYEPIEFESCGDFINTIEEGEFSLLLNTITNLEVELSELFNKLFTLKSRDRVSLVDILKRSVRLADYYSIFTSFLLNHKEHEVIPIIETYSSLNITNNKVAGVINVVINNFPYINVSTSIESLVDFKSDLDVKHKLNALKCAIYDISKNVDSITEIKDKIEYLLNEYREQLKLHDKNIQYNNYQIFVSSTLGVIESLFKMELSGLISNVISLKKDKINLLLEKKNLKGVELAYIVDAIKVFDNPVI